MSGKTIQYLHDNNFNEFMESSISNIEINFNEMDNIRNIFSNKKLLQYFINNNIKPQSDYTNLIQYICIYSPDDIIKYFIDLYINNDYDLKSDNGSGYEIINTVCENCSVDIIKYMIDIYMSPYGKKNHFDIQLIKYYDDKPIHIICKRLIKSPEGIDVIKYIIDIYIKNDYRLDCINYYNDTPIHYIYRYSTKSPEGKDIIKYITDIYKSPYGKKMGYNLNCKNSAGYTPFDYLMVPYN
jgi:hypothetical protein